MTLKILFIVGIIVDAFAFILTVGNLWMIQQSGISADWSGDKGVTGLTIYGQLMRWIIPAVLLLLIMLGFWLKSRGKLVLANIILWIPALPFFIGVLIWAFLALAFILFSKQ